MERKVKVARKTRKAAAALAEPQRVTRKALAAMLGLHHSTVYEVCSHSDAPRPGPDLKYDLTTLKAYVEAKVRNSPQGGAADLVTIKKEKAALELARMKREDAAHAGKLVPLDKVQEEMEGVISQQDSLLRDLFVHELPAKYAGKTLEERRQLNEQAIERFVAAFKAGLMHIVPAPAEALELVATS